MEFGYVFSVKNIRYIPYLFSIYYTSNLFVGRMGAMVI